MQFELTNIQRKYLGLEEVQDNWDLFKLNEEVFLYFDKDKIVKKITCNPELYHECELDEKTIDRKILLPKTGKGKSVKDAAKACRQMCPNTNKRRSGDKTGVQKTGKNKKLNQRQIFDDDSSEEQNNQRREFYDYLLDQIERNNNE